MLSPLSKQRRARPLLGTIVEISVAGAADGLSPAIDAAFAAIEQVQRLMSFHEESSDVSRINAAEIGSDIEIDPHTYRVLQFSRQLGDQSAGVFDIATAAVLVREGFLPSRPQQEPAVDVTYQDLELLANDQVRWRRKGWIDLGGIAKGYAVDCAIAVLQSHDVTSGTVNAGGDLRCFGEAQPIHVRHPESPTSLVSLGWLSNAAIATSGGYFSSSGNDVHRRDPLVDVKRRSCITWDESISVAAQNCMTADALTKVVRLTNAAAAETLMKYQAQAIAINQTTMRSSGMKRLHEAMS